MQITLPHIFAIIIGLTIITLLIIVFARNLQGHQATLSLSRAMLIPLLCGISMVAGYVYQSPTRTIACAPAVNTFITTGSLLIVGLLVGGLLLFMIGRFRDTSVFVRASLIAAIITTGIFVVTFLGNCL